MRIMALIDIHPLDGSNPRGLSMRIVSGGQMFDLPISKEQASMLLAKIAPKEEPRAPIPPSAEEVSLFAQFASDAEERQAEYYDTSAHLGAGQRWSDGGIEDEDDNL